MCFAKRRLDFEFAKELGFVTRVRLSAVPQQDDVDEGFTACGKTLVRV
jgi:hypothetical protein